MNKRYLYLFLVICLGIFLYLFIFKTIPGTYVANRNTGADTLKIFSNHKYVRICYPPNDTIHYVDTGSWKAKNGVIWFRNWYDRNGLYVTSINESGIYGADIDRALFIGRRRLAIDYDLEYYYIKQSWW